ncbi:helix-turn-helix domain-containing protein [Lachnoclostridium phytofermentans]|uniref:Transcriptional regulator, AraC family n=1 Tax=Lachnoclostridium phytofermentans (strain ATCC 700394 / DSM 18823 / ISDg) TaxID=357809 RepID=A9KR08_LACP7|nr:AraC family transcriptional regulator [Lachnoclostridium phytofermentans]ABX43487.1 transcriptional regulator, AraC family [Lachnoclostridium phytofermentans ISDg]
MSNLTSIFDSIEYINKNIPDVITIEQCSKIADMSIPYFIESFKQIIGYTPYKYIKKRRLELSTQSLLKQNRILDIAVDNGYESNEAYTRAFLLEYGIAPSEYRKAGIECAIDELSDIEKIVAFLPAPIHKEYFGDLYYLEHKEIYDSLIRKGFFDKNTLDYRIEAKQLTEKYSHEYSQIIICVMKISNSLPEVYSKVSKIKPLPKLLFYSFVKDLADNGLLKSTIFNTYMRCTKCKFLLATLGDANFIREQVIQEYKNRNINLSIEEINCLGFGSEKCLCN